MISKALHLLLILAQCGTCLCQISYTSKPKDLQMFPRNESDNCGSFTLAGVCAGQNVKAIKSVLRENGADTVVERLTSSTDPLGKFVAHHKVPARLSEFNLYIYTVEENGKENLADSVRYLVAGDFYLIAGQSNAEATGGHDPEIFRHDSLYSLPSCRALGANFSMATSINESTGMPKVSFEDDCLMGRPSALYGAYGRQGFVNTWGLKLQHDLALASGIPSCFVNAAKGALNILECSPSRIPSDPDSLRYDVVPGGPKPLPYDRVFKKLYLNGVLDGVKAVFWNQGEADGASSLDTALSYKLKFMNLYRAWSLDFPNLKKVFVMQISIGCGGEYLRLIADIQRKLPSHMPSVVLMSTIGFEFHERHRDNCHFTLDGYLSLADKLMPLALSHLYGDGKVAPRFVAPDIRKVYYSEPSVICVEFDTDIHVQQHAFYPPPVNKTAYMTDNFFTATTLDKPLDLHAVTHEGNKMYLHLKEDQDVVTNLTYLPSNYPQFASIFAGPWIVNAENHKIGALCFYEAPVEEYQVKSPEKDFMVTPNPGKNYCMVVFKDSTDRKLRVFDMYGKEWATYDMFNKRQLFIDLTTFPSGLFIVRDEKTGVARRLIKR